MKRLLIFVLAVVMLLSAMPFAAFAADEGETSGDESTDYEYHDEKVSTAIGPFDYGKDWRDYESYIHYEGNEEGYSISSVYIIVTEDFFAEGKAPEASDFPKIEEKISRIAYVKYGEEREYDIFLDWEYLSDDRGLPIYSEEMIDEFISIVRYLTSFSFIEIVHVSLSSIVYTGDSIDPGTTEPDVTEPAMTEPATTEPDSTEAVTTEPETTEVIGAATESGDNTGNGLNNHQTGDMLFIYLSGLLLSAGIILVTTAAITKKKVNR